MRWAGDARYGGRYYPETKARRQPSLPARSPSASTLRVSEVYHTRQAMPARFYPLVLVSAAQGDAGARPLDRFTPPLWVSRTLSLQTLYLDEAL